jgi:hypothetical protein
MYDLAVLRGMRELLGQTSLQEGDNISFSMLKNALPDLADEEIEEMIWSADSAENKGGGKLVDFGMVLAVLRTPTGEPCEIPSRPLLESKAYVDWVQIRRNADWVRDTVIDFREATDWIPPQRRKSEHGLEFTPFVSEEKEETKIPDTCAAKLLLLLDYPESSVAANNLSLVMGIMILVSVLTLFIEPLSLNLQDETISDGEKTVWTVFEAFFTALFTIEYVLTFAVCNALGTQTHLEFLRTPMRVCDVLAVMPFYIDMAVDAEQAEFRLFRIARLMRLSRLVRLGRLAKRSATFAPIAMILVVIWGIYMKNGLKE